MISLGQVVSSHSKRRGHSSFFTHASIDSRRSSCSSVNRRCLRCASCWGLMTVAASTLAPSPPLSDLSRYSRETRQSRAAVVACWSAQHRVLLHTLCYGARVGEGLVLYEVSDGVATV